MRVLVAEDEAQLARYIARGLTRHGMAVDVAADGELALRKAHARPYDVVVLDRDLPLVHGDDVCRSLLHNLPETRGCARSRGEAAFARRCSSTATCRSTPSPASRAATDGRLL